MIHNEENSKICIECQECCKWATFHANFSTRQAVKEYWEVGKARGFSMKKKKGNLIRISVHCPCPQLAKDGCEIYSTRPKLCRDYDGRIDPYMKRVCKLPK